MNELGDYTPLEQTEQLEDIKEQDYEVLVSHEVLENGIESTTFEIGGSENYASDPERPLASLDQAWKLSPHEMRADMLIRFGREIWESVGEFVRGIIEVDDDNTGYDAADGFLYVKRESLYADTMQEAAASISEKKESEV
jgi:hypothetical protein